MQLFFVLSGFLITGILLDDRGAPHALRSFYVRRSLRIFPLYYAFLGLRFLVVPLFVTAATVPFSRQLGAWLYLSNWTDLALGAPAALGHLWSLAVEEQFYLAWPLLVAKTRAATFARVCGTIAVVALGARIAIALTGSPPAWAYASTVTRADALAIGALVALAVRSEVGRERLARALPTLFWASLAGVALVAAKTHGLSRTNPLVQTLGYTLLAVLFGAVVGGVALGRAPRGAALLSHPALRLVGKYSYAIYIVHLPLKSVVLHLTTPRFGAVETAAADVLFVSAVAIASFAIAAVTYVAIERPLLARKDAWAPRTPC